jgi:zinc-ribbon domain
MAKISEFRKNTYYFGIGLMIFGFIMFLSNFVIMPLTDVMDNERNGIILFLVLALGGMILAIVGSIVKSIGARGLAGSGVLLDPERAREDLKPYSEMVGGMAKDAMGQGVVFGNPKIVERVKVRCPKCRALNDEDARFCDQCGSKL